MAKTFMSSKFHVESTTKIQEKKRILHPLLQEIIKEIQLCLQHPCRRSYLLYMAEKTTFAWFRDFAWTFFAFCRWNCM